MQVPGTSWAEHQSADERHKFESSLWFLGLCYFYNFQPGLEPNGHKVAPIHSKRHFEKEMALSFDSAALRRLPKQTLPVFLTGPAQSETSTCIVTKTTVRESYSWRIASHCHCCYACQHAALACKC